MSRRPGPRLAGLIACALAMSAAHGPRLAAQAGRQPIFKGGVELIAVDVTVVDRNGNPVPGVLPDQFEVSIDGKPRRVVSAEFIEFVARNKPVRAGSEPPLAARPVFTSNDQPPAAESAGRLIYLAIDQGSFRTFGERGAMEAARRFIDRLQPEDRIGLVAFPGPGPSVAASRDHAAARAATTQIAGRAQPFRAEGLDKNVSLSEAIDIRAGDSMTLQKVLARECPGSASDRQVCELMVRSTAQSIGQNAEVQATRSLSGVEAVIRSLAQIRERKTLVLISAGLPVADRAGMDLQFTPEIVAIGREAAAANLNLFVLHVDSGFLDAFSAENRTISDTLYRDLSIMSGGLETIAGASGGSLVRIVAGADFAFERVERETAAAYILGVEPLEGDRDGKPHRISVKVKIPNAEVRSRREVLLPKPVAEPAPPATPEDAVRTAFQAGRLETALPLRVATHCLAPDVGGKYRVLISADIGRNNSGPAEMWTAYAITDAAGRMREPVGQKRTVRPRAAGPAGAVSYTTQVILEAGSYTLRFAAADATSAAGSVDHAFTVGVTKGDGVWMSDLVLMEPLVDVEDRVDVVTDGRLRGTAIDTYIEVVPTLKAPDAPTVTFSIAPRPESAPLLSAAASMVRPENTEHWSATARLDLATLAPGDYVISAIVSAGDHVAGRVDRPVHIEPPAR